MPQLSQHSLYTKRKDPRATPSNSDLAAPPLAAEGQPGSDARHPLPRGRGHSRIPLLHCSPPRACPSTNAHPPAAEGQGPFSNSDAPPFAAEGQPGSDARHPLPRGKVHSPIPMLHRLLPRGSPGPMHATRCRGAGATLQFRCSTVRRRGAALTPMHTACPLPRGRGRFPIPLFAADCPFILGQPEGAGPGPPLAPRRAGALLYQFSFSSKPGLRERWR